ncbi:MULTISPECIES: dynamin family protein [Acinetobacter]|uniref:dynamin family protein n=1 Tax=Acinetobacter TaxID=469 RepID=UPI001F4B98DB|nr:MULTISPECIES: dynamin family protein [Acinetobacter]MCH7381314.1 dynamin family protein [Acinetobacter higginsii]
MESAILSISRPELLNIFKELQQKFNFSQEQDQVFKSYCHQFQQNMASYLKASEHNISKNNPLFQQIGKFRSILEETNQNWQKKITTQDTGVHFRAGFNDSLLVFVYGKVKSGKSSLGNYMAWGHTDPTEQQKSEIQKELQPVYFSGQKTEVKGGDVAKEAEIKKEFRVGATEATSSIQGFSLDGLTWIDSPGLHSINQENGDLAKDYVEHADLILYTMKSDSPGRESDLNEILNLYRADKKIILLLTGSDDVAHDWDDEKDEMISTIVMKDRQRRLDQQKYVRSALEKIPELAGKTNNIEILSFSARYAQENEGQVDNFADSGMGQLFAALGKIAREDGVKLKHRTPMLNFKNFLTDFMSDLENYAQLIVDFQQPIERIQKSIPIQINEHKRLIQQQLSQKVDAEFESLTPYRDDPIQMKQAIKKIADTLAQQQNEAMITSQQTILQQVMSEFGSQLTNVIQHNALLDLPEFKIEQRTEQVADSVTSGTRRRNGGLGALGGGILGGAIGILGGPAGVATGASIGSTLGGWLGGKTGDDASVNYREITLNVGDNLIHIQKQFSERLQNSIQVQMTEFQKTLLEMALNSAEHLVTQLKNEINSFQKQLNSMFLETETKLNG